MNLLSLMAGAVTISTLHALLPSHWLPFVLIGSAQGWRRGKIMKIALLAGGAHVTMTSTLGLAAATISGGIVSYLGYFETYVSSGILILLGLAYVFHGVAHKNSHSHSFKGESSDRATTASLFLMLTISPCEAVIPLFFAAGSFGWSILFALSLFVALGTIGSMLALVCLTLAGYKKLRFAWLERNEKTAIGTILFSSRHLCCATRLRPLTN
jgi:nickel/cobalt exporter